jgi:hypothetical protein
MFETNFVVIVLTGTKEEAITEKMEFENKMSVILIYRSMLLVTCNALCF